MPGFAKAAPVARTEDFFAQLGVERTFALDLEDLERRYLERSKQVHPDRFVGRPAAERVAAMSSSMDLNKAYRALKNPVMRAEHFLALHGVRIGDHETLDPQFLMEVLEAREELAEAKAQGDRESLSRLRRDMEGRERQTLERIAASLAAFEADRERAALETAKRDLILMRYIRRYLEAFESDDEDNE